MEQSSILEKLRKLLLVDITDESQVVYVLIEIRKYLDLTNTSSQYKVLRMFCNWVAHIGLDRLGNDSILHRLDDVIDKASSAGSVSNEVNEVVNEISSLRVFEMELTRFLVDCSLPTKVVEPGFWGRFVDLYVNVISECPLEHSSAKPLKYIKSATLTVDRGQRKTSDDTGCVFWNWDIVLNDGTHCQAWCALGYTRGAKASQVVNEKKRNRKS